MVATLPAGVPDAAYVSDAREQESGEHWVSTAADSFAACEELGQADWVFGVVGDPALGREVSELESVGGHADAALAEGDDDVAGVHA